MTSIKLPLWLRFFLVVGVVVFVFMRAAAAYRACGSADRGASHVSRRRHDRAGYARRRAYHGAHDAAAKHDGDRANQTEMLFAHGTITAATGVQKQD